jgi:hypothetical protein
VCTRLGAEHDPADGVRGLPDEAKAAFYVERERVLRGEGSEGTCLSAFEELARLAADLPPEHVRNQMAEARRRPSRRGLTG